MEDKILIWLNSKPLISVNRLCKMVDYNMSNFQKSAKQGIVPLKIRSRLVEVLSEYGYSETTDYEIPKMFDAQIVERKDDEFRIPAQPITINKAFDGIKFDESLMDEPIKRQYSLAEYIERISESYGFIEDQKKIADDIRADENNLTIPQKRDLLAKMGLTK